jgi:hypothetical protein
LKSPMKTIIFGGPSINNDLKARFAKFKFRGPAQQGDIYQAAESSQANRLILLDGYYKTVPAVWHKEVIYAINKGITVIGSSSLGALRAVELEPYGMKGYGRIYQWYRDGILDRDPDVAVTHTSGEDNFRTLTIPVVNVLATIKDSSFNFKLELIEEVLRLTRSIFFEQRTMSALVSKIDSSELEAIDKKNIINELSEKYVDQKLKDSEATLEWIKNEEARITPLPIAERLNETLYWDAMVVNDSYVTPSSTGLLQTKQALLAYQLLEKPDDYMRMRERAISIELCQWIGSLYGIKAETTVISRMKVQLLSDLELTESDLNKWLWQRGLSERSLEEYLSACAIEREIKEKAKYRSPMCSFNRQHYSILAISKDSSQMIESFKEFERRLGEETISAIDEISETVESLPKETMDIIEQYREEMLIEKSSDSIGRVTSMPTNYLLTFAKLHGSFRQIINQMLYNLFVG